MQLLEVSVPNQKKAQLLLVRGRAWACAGFVLSPHQLLLTPEVLLTTPPQDLLFLPSRGGGGEEPSNLEIELTPSEGGSASAVMIIGHVRSSKAEAKPGLLEYNIEGLTDDVNQRGFSVDLPKGTVEAGATKQVKCQPFLSQR